MLVGWRLGEGWVRRGDMSFEKDEGWIIFVGESVLNPHLKWACYLLNAPKNFEFRVLYL